MMAFAAAVASSLLLPPAAPRVQPSSPNAAELLRPPASTEVSPHSILDAAALAAFRWQLQQQSGCQRDEPGFEGMLSELRDYQAGHTVDEQIKLSSDVMVALAGPIPWLFNRIWSHTSWAPGILAWFTRALLPFLVGEMTLTQRAPGDARAGGVTVHRCKVLDQSGCAGLCLNMCKRPTEKLFADKWGVPLYMQPNFETHECSLSFGVVPLPAESDPAIPRGCLAGCPLSEQPTTRQHAARAAQPPTMRHQPQTTRLHQVAPYMRAIQRSVALVCCHLVLLSAIVACTDAGALVPPASAAIPSISVCPAAFKHEHPEASHLLPRPPPHASI